MTHLEQAVNKLHLIQQQIALRDDASAELIFGVIYGYVAQALDHLANVAQDQDETLQSDLDLKRAAIPHFSVE